MIRFNVGDVVKAETFRETYIGVIKEIRPRYGYINDGRDNQNPLVNLHVIEEDKYLDSSFITKVIEYKLYSPIIYNKYRRCSELP